MATAELPEELITEILLRLPVKVLKRFRCLAKLLCELIDSPQFIDSHFSKSSQNLILRKLIFQDPSRKEFHVCDVNLDLEEEVLRLQNPVSSPWESVRGYCKGLLLLYSGEFRFILWNPSTRQSRNLPSIPLEAPSDNQIYSITGWGLGYDDLTEDYKVICVKNVERKVDPKLEVQFWIYGFKSNIWRRSNNCESPLLSLTHIRIGYLLPGFGHFADGIIHWACAISSFRRVLVAFDVRRETLSFPLQPVCSLKLESREDILTKLHALEGCLCISYVSSSMPLQADLYIRRKEEGGQFAWTQLFSVTEPLFVDQIWFMTVHVFGYLKRGDKIMLDLGMTDYMVSYDLKEKSFEKVEIAKDCDWMDPIICLESLVPLAGGA